ncbi:hypothetical protein GALL_353900 [mine drainage metagenome]|uniref:Uncharacterized protein n=1 Tax=mine drainage metagenome TaxID=410659 RepID=A0A1J5R3T0_9ZZZZ
MGEIAHEVRESADVEVVLEALARGLEQDREVRVVRRDAEQLRRAVALLPERLATVRASSRQQERTGRGLPEPRAEQRGPGQLRAHRIGDLVRVDQEVVEGERGTVVAEVVARVGARGGRPAHERVRETQDDAVVRVHGRHVDTGRAQTTRDHERPGCVDACAVRRVDHDAPVPDLVRERLHDDGPVVRHLPGRRALVAEVCEQVLGRPAVEPDAREHVRWGRGTGSGVLELAHPGADRPSELCRPARRVTLPEREATRRTGRGGDEHLVRGDVVDAPGARPQGERVADAGLVHHLLVELADPPAAAHARPGAVSSSPARGLVRTGDCTR